MQPILTVLKYRVAGQTWHFFGHFSKVVGPSQNWWMRLNNNNFSYNVNCSGVQVCDAAVIDADNAHTVTVKWHHHHTATTRQWQHPLWQRNVNLIQPTPIFLPQQQIPLMLLSRWTVRTGRRLLNWNRSSVITRLMQPTADISSRGR